MRRPRRPCGRGRKLQGGRARKVYGLDAASLRKAYPRLVFCSITGFGQHGPYAERAGYDFLIQGMAGAMSITGDAKGQPTKTGYATADIFTGMYATVGILARSAAATPRARARRSILH